MMLDLDLIKQVETGCGRLCETGPTIWSGSAKTATNGAVLLLICCRISRVIGHGSMNGCSSPRLPEGCTIDFDRRCERKRSNLGPPLARSVGIASSRKRS